MKRKSLSIASALAITAPLILAAPVDADGISSGAAVGIDFGSLLLGGTLGDPLAAPPPPYAYPPPIYAYPPLVYYAPPPRCEWVANYDLYGELAGYVPRRACQ